MADGGQLEAVSRRLSHPGREAELDGLCSVMSRVTNMKTSTSMRMKAEAGSATTANTRTSTVGSSARRPQRARAQIELPKRRKSESACAGEELSQAEHGGIESDLLKFQLLDRYQWHGTQYHKINLNLNLKI